MKMEIAFLQSKLARRIFWLFVACALLPIGILAIISLWNVSGELQQEGWQALHQLSHEEGMAVYERLLVLESQMKEASVSLNDGLILQPPTLGKNDPFEGGFEGIALIRPGEHERLISGHLDAQFEPNEQQRAFLALGKTV